MSAALVPLLQGLSEEDLIAEFQCRSTDIVIMRGVQCRAPDTMAIHDREACHAWIVQVYVEERGDGMPRQIGPKVKAKA
jgi:hypothetical protein